MFKSYSFIQRNRMRKKADIYKLFLSITLDFTSILYLAILLGYALFAFYQVGEVPEFFQQLIALLSNVLENNKQLIWLFSFLPIYFLMQSFQRPGVVFSSAKFLLSILPHHRNRLWFLSFANKLLMTALKLSLLAAIVYVIAPLTLKRVIVLVLLTLLFILVMTIIQWKLYQLHVGVRIVIIAMTSILTSASVFTNNTFISIIYILFLSGLFYYSARNLFTSVDWSRVIAASDFLIWNMQFISQATKIKFKKDEQPSLWYRLPSWKEPFRYEKDFAYNRLWYIYGEKEVSIILRMTGALFLLVLVVSYFSQFYYTLFVAIAIHIQASLLVSLFKDRLYTGLVNALPWDLVGFQKTFSPWAMLVSLVLLIPTGFYAVFYFGKIFIFYLIYIAATFYYIVHVQVQKCIHELDDSNPYSQTYEVVAYILLLILIFSSLYPYLLIVGFLSLALMSSVIFQTK